MSYHQRWLASRLTRKVAAFGKESGANGTCCEDTIFGFPVRNSLPDSSCSDLLNFSDSIESDLPLGSLMLRALLIRRLAQRSGVPARRLVSTNISFYASHPLPSPPPPLGQCARRMTTPPPQISTRCVTLPLTAIVFTHRASQ